MRARAAVIALLGGLAIRGAQGEPVRGPVAISAPPGAANLLAIVAPDRSIVAIDPADPARQRMVVAAPGPDDAMPVALAGCGTATVVAVCRRGDDWSLCTWRIEPDEPAAAAAPLQALPLGASVGTAVDAGDRVQLVVSDTRDWLAVGGLPAPLPTVLRAAIAGNRVAKPAEQPRAGAVPRVAALAASPGDELVTCEVPDGADDTATLVFHGVTGEELLRLDTGLVDVVAAAFDRGDGALYVLAGRAGADATPSGLWRLDATLRDRRQAIRPVLLAPLDAPRALACPAAGVVVVAQGDAARTLARLEPARLQAAKQAADGGAAP